MEFLTTWLLLASIQAAATISPGPAFAMTVRNSVSGTRRDGILTAFGLGLGVGFYVILVAFGVALLISQSPAVYLFLKYAGAAYLVYIGGKSLLLSRKQVPATVAPLGPIKRAGGLRRIQNGLLTNILNPKALVFFTAVYAQFITPDTPWEYMLVFCLTSVAIEFIWFALVTLFLTTPRVRTAFLGIKHWIERVTGGFMVLLGLKLAFSR